jgi:hypothetical protein
VFISQSEICTLEMTWKKKGRWREIWIIGFTFSSYSFMNILCDDCVQKTCFSFFLLCRVGYIVAFTKVLTMYQMYHSWIHPLHLYHPSPYCCNTSIGNIFAFTYMCTHFCTVFTLLPPFPATFSLPLLPPLPLSGPVLPSCSPIMYKKRKRQFCLFEIKVATQGVSLWYFHVYVYPDPKLVHLLYFLHSMLVSFLRWFQPV